MKRFFLILFLLIPLCSYGQGQIYTRKTRLQGYENKIMKVVESGNLIMDHKLKEEVARRWNVSPYEFCTDQEFEKQKTDGSFFFLHFIAEDAPDSLHQLISLRLLKGGPEGKDKLDSGFEVLSIPVGYYENGGIPLHNIQLFAAYVDMFQNYIKEAALSERVAYLGLNAMVDMNMKGKKYYFSEMDLSVSMTPDQREKYFGTKVFALTEDQWTDILEKEEEDAVVGVCITPSTLVEGAYCYKYLIGADDHVLHYYVSPHTRNESDRGFLPIEISVLSKKK